MEFLESLSQEHGVQLELILIFILLLWLLSTIQFVLVEAVEIASIATCTILLLFLFFFFHALLFLLFFLVVQLLIAIKGFHKQFNVLHIVDIKGFSNRVNLDLESLLGVSVLRQLVSSIINQVWSLVDQESEDILHTLVLFAGIGVVFSANTLFILIDSRSASALWTLRVND